jgi:hypothetical protein
MEEWKGGSVEREEVSGKREGEKGRNEGMQRKEGQVRTWSK